MCPLIAKSGQRTRCITFTKVCASSAQRRWVILVSSSLEKIASIKEVSSVGSKVYLIRREHAGVWEVRKNEPRCNQYPGGYQAGGVPLSGMVTRAVSWG